MCVFLQYSGSITIILDTTLESRFPRMAYIYCYCFSVAPKCFFSFCREDNKSEEGGADGESMNALKEELQELKEQLVSSHAELEELKEQMRLGVLSVDCSEGNSAVTGAGMEGGSEEGSNQELRARVTELEEELASLRKGETEGLSSPDNDTIKQLTETVKELQAALEQKESVKVERENDKEEESDIVKSLQDKVAELEAALLESRSSGNERGTAGSGESDQVRRLQERLGELEAELRKRVPRSELEEVQVTLGLQCEQLARERADVARRLNEALLELERLRPPQHGDDEEEEEEHSERSERSVISGTVCSLVHKCIENNPQLLFSQTSAQFCINQLFSGFRHFQSFKSKR